MGKIDLVDEKEIALIEQVNDVYLNQGIKNITMDDMAKLLRVSKKTLYKYVKNRGELVEKSTFFHIQRDKLEVERIQAANYDSMTEMHHLAQHVIKTLSKMNPVVHSDLKNHFPKSWDRLQDYFHGYVFGTIHSNVLRGQESGDYRQDINPEITAKIFITKLDLVFDAELFPSDRFSFVDVYLNFIQQHLRGISTLQGYQKLEDLDFSKLK